MAVSTQVNEVKAFVTVDQTDQFTASVPGGAKNRCTDCHKGASLYAYADGHACMLWIAH
jgi:hypothetical protein